MLRLIETLAWQPDRTLGIVTLFEQTSPTLLIMAR
jgi:hypothetical protein